MGKPGDMPGIQKVLWIGLRLDVYCSFLMAIIETTR